MSSVNLFNIGKSGLTVSKQAMTTTGHNIANVNTEGYSRQNVEITSAPLTSHGRLIFGNGAWARKVGRVSDEYLERRIQAENKNFSGAEEKDIYLHQTEQIFNESENAGLNQLVSRFFNEFRQLSSDPGNTAIRSSVREASTQLASEVRRMDQDLRSVAKNIDERLSGYVRELNSLAKEVRQLNFEIGRAELAGGEAPDLLDKRDMTLKKLGALADISVSKDKNGSVTVSLAGQVTIVSGETVNELEVTRTPADAARGKKEDHLDIFVRNPVAERVTQLFKGGRLGGLLEVRDKDISTARDEINKVAHLITREVNNIHRQGFGLDGASGRDFFEESGDPSRAASNMRLSDHVSNNLQAIAAAKDPGAAGDNRIAIALSAIGEMKGLAGDTNSSIIDVYNSMVSGLAVKTGECKKELTFQKDVLDQLQNVRESLVGVNLDEETANLLKFQHSYAASAKILQVADETTQTLLNTFK